jgi:glycosyltransferase involved in cell wall biosynthesis
MRILVICREIPPVGGGAGRVALDLATHLAARGHEIHILTMHHGDLPAVEAADGVTIERLRVGRKHRDSSYAPSMARFAWSAVRRGQSLEGFDMVHAHAIIPDGFIARRAAHHLGVPYAITAHGTDVPGYDDRRFRLAHRLLAPLWRRIVNGADLITTPSEYLRGLIRGHDPEAAVRVIPNGVDPDDLHPGDKDGSFLIVSRLIARKNYAAFFEATASIDGPLEIHVVGDGPEAPRLREIAAKTNHRVTFHGWLDHGGDAWRALYERCRFLVFPSIGENFPVNLLEAQLAGMTVLAAPAAGSREVLGDAAIYFDDHSTDAIGRTLRAVQTMGDAELDAVGIAGRRRVEDRFSWATVTERFVRAFGETLEADADA